MMTSPILQYWRVLSIHIFSSEYSIEGDCTCSSGWSDLETTLKSQCLHEDSVPLNPSRSDRKFGKPWDVIDRILLLIQEPSYPLSIFQDLDNDRLSLKPFCSHALNTMSNCIKQIWCETRFTSLRTKTDLNTAQQVSLDFRLTRTIFWSGLLIDWKEKNI